MMSPLSSRLLVIFAAFALALSACSTAPTGQPGGHYKVGKPYTINGKRYTPRHQPGYNEVGVASWYGKDFHGRKTANGETYDMNAMSAAHPTLPLPSLVRVTNLTNGKTEMLRVNDRGPFARDRIIDVSRAASQKLGFQQTGTTKVRVEYVGLASLNPSDPFIVKPAATTLIASRAEPKGAVTGPAQSGPSPSGTLATAGQTYFISSSVSDPLEAELLRQEFRERYAGTMIIPLQTEAKADYYKVRIGPISSQKEALDHLRSVREGGHQDAIITFDQGEGTAPAQ